MAKAQSENKPVRVAPFKKFLPVKLKAEEIRTFTRQLVERMQDRDIKEFDLAQHNKKIKQEIENMDGEIARFRRLVHDESEDREVDCEIRYDFEKKIKQHVRVDTGEVFEEHKMTEMELQLKFDDLTGKGIGG